MLENTLTDDLKTAMKDKDALKVSTLRLIIAAIKNTRIDKMVKSLDDATVIGILKKQVKQRQDSIEQFTKANRLDLSDKEAAEMKIIQSYLPQEISEEALRTIIATAIAETGATSAKDMGTVMKAVMAKTGGNADGKIISTLVRERLK